MINIIVVNLRGFFRDRIFHGIFMTAVLFLFIPVISSLSMRQVTELSMTLALSLISFILLLLSVFLGGASLWKDMERKYTFSVLSLPLPRSTYVLGKFSGVSLFLLLVALFLGTITIGVVLFSSTIYPPSRPVIWTNLYLAIIFDVLKYILLVAYAFLFSTVSTSFFLPIFGTVSVFIVGCATQDAYEFVQTPSGQKLPAIVQILAKTIYYVLPNFSAFDLKVNAIYAIKVSGQGLGLTLGYFIVYLAFLLFLATESFLRREIK